MEMTKIFVIYEDSLRTIVNDEIARLLHTQIKEEKQVDSEFEWVNNTEAMKLLGLSRPTLQRYRTTGKLPFSKVGSNIYYRRSDLDNLLKENLQCQ
jgi:excisionase family DNA binding protein